MSKNSPWVSSSRFIYNRLKIKRGIGRLLMSVAQNRKSLHALPVKMNDGRTLILDLRQIMCLPYVLTGEIWEEKGETDFVKFVVAKGDTVIDIGTNIGWYTSLLGEAVGSNGTVYGFEPGAEAFALVSKTAEFYPHVEINQLALSDFEGEVDFYLSNDRGQSSLRKPQNTASVQKCRVTTLDAFLQTKGNPLISFIKCDAEGAELPILRGATQLLSSEKPPIWMLEINAPMMRSFDYEPEELFDFFNKFPQAGYTAYRLHSQTGKLEDVPAPIDFRFDAVFIPAWQADKAAKYSAQIA